MVNNKKKSKQSRRRTQRAAATNGERWATAKLLPGVAQDNLRSVEVSAPNGMVQRLRMSPREMLHSCCSIEEFAKCCVDGTEMPLGPATEQTRNSPIWFPNPTFQVLHVDEQVDDYTDITLSDGATFWEFELYNFALRSRGRAADEVAIGSLLQLTECEVMDYDEQYDQPGLKERSIIILDFAVVFPPLPLIGQPLGCPIEGPSGVLLREDADEAMRHSGLHGSAVLRILRLWRQTGSGLDALVSACVQICKDVKLFAWDANTNVGDYADFERSFLSAKDKPLIDLLYPSGMILSVLAWQEDWSYDSKEVSDVVSFLKRRSFDDLVGKLRRRQCATCGRRGSPEESHFRLCGGCMSLRFCSTDCQRAAWIAGGHQNRCLCTYKSS